ncbi:hypothetical protein FB570_11969 [Streptomyces sp. T12]|nr:hypothetical protein FB570_11969 [Streptomyces sp. T12]
MIEDLLPVLGAAGLRPDARELCDALWLAPHVRAAPAVPDDADADAASAEPATATSNAAPVDPPGRAAGSGTARTTLHARREEDGAGGVAAMEARGPAVPALRHQLRLARALRPFKRRVPDPSAFVVDERATAARIAEEGLWSPVLRPAPRRWLDLTLVVDAAPTMVVWRRTVAELRALTEQMGAFRTVRVLRLYAPPDPAEAVLLLPEGQGGVELPPEGPDGKGRRSPASLETTAGGQAVLVVTDTVGPAWNDGRLYPMLRGWAAGAPLAVVTLLPQRMWSGARLRAVPAALRAPFPGAPNAALNARVRSRPGAGTPLPPPNVPVPVLELSERWLAQWADLVAGAPSWRNTALLVPQAAPVRARTPRPALSAAQAVAETVPAAGTLSATGTGDAPDGSSTGAHFAADPAAVVRRFRAAASPTAFRLACCLSAAWLNLPVMRLVQRVALPESDTSHLAEVYLGGLLTAPMNSAGADAEQVAYDFLPGVRAELNQYLTRHDLVDILERTSAFVSEQFGQPLDFPALLADPASAELPVRTGGGPPLAHVAASVLAQLGGQYAVLAARLPRAAVPDAGPVDTASVPEEAPLDATLAPAAGSRNAAPASATPATPAAPADSFADRATAQSTAPASPAAARPSVAPPEAPGRGLCLTFELEPTARIPGGFAHARQAAESRLRELLSRALADDGIDGIVTDRRENFAGRLHLIVALGARQSALSEAARLLLALARMVGEPVPEVQELVHLPIGVAITVGAVRDGATDPSTSAHRQARNLLASMTTVRSARGATEVQGPDTRSPAFPFQVAVSGTVYGMLVERLESVDTPSRGLQRQVDDEMNLSAGHLLADPRGVLEAVGGTVAVPDAATRAPRVFLSAVADDAETRRGAQELRHLLAMGGVVIAEASDRPDRRSGSDWHDQLVAQIRRCERILVVASAYHRDGAGGSSNPFQKAEEQLIRDRYARPDQVLTVLLPGSSPAGLPGYLRKRKAFVLKSLTPSGVAQLLHHLLHRRTLLTGTPDDGDTAEPPALARAVVRAAATEQEERQADAQASPIALRSHGDGDGERGHDERNLGSFSPEDGWRHLSLDGSGGVTPRARNFARQVLFEWGWLPVADAQQPTWAEDVMLVVSELVMNATVHAGGADALRLHRQRTVLRVEVEDSGGEEPLVRPYHAGRTGGHGLFIVQRLSLDWGVRRLSDRPGKTVWAEIAGPGHPAQRG